MDNSGIEHSLLGLHSQELSNSDFRRNSLSALLLRYLHPEWRAIDVGCGTGYVTRRLAPYVSKMTGVDPSEKLIQRAKELSSACNRLSFSVAEVEQIEDRYDCVICLDVIEHIEADIEFLSRLYRILSAGGTLLLTVPALPSLYSVRDEEIGHFRRYTLASLRGVISDAGFEVGELKFWNLLGVVPYWFYGKVLNRPINDSLREGRESSLKVFVRSILEKWLDLEGRTRRLPLGLTLICIAKKP